MMTVSTTTKLTSLPTEIQSALERIYTTLDRFLIISKEAFGRAYHQGGFILKPIKGSGDDYFILDAFWIYYKVHDMMDRFLFNKSQLLKSSWTADVEDALKMCVDLLDPPMDDLLNWVYGVEDYAQVLRDEWPRIPVASLRYELRCGNTIYSAARNATGKSKLTFQDRWSSPECLERLRKIKLYEPRDTGRFVWYSSPKDEEDLTAMGRMFSASGLA
jgi:hypothetical protein